MSPWARLVVTRVCTLRLSRRVRHPAARQAVCLMTRVIEHGVPPITPERIAFAYFNRIDVCKHWAQGDVEVELARVDDFHAKLTAMSEEIKLSTM